MLNRLLGVRVQCPYCWERFELLVDASVEQQEYVEDCPVCCCPNVIHVEFEEDGDVRLARTLDFGSFRVRDRVRLQADGLCVIDVEPAAGYPASRLTIRIEEPVPGSLFLRFTYEAPARPDEAGEDPVTDRLLEPWVLDVSRRHTSGQALPRSRRHLQ